MRILELTTYSAGICGVFARVKEEAVLLSKAGHTVKIFSTNFVKAEDRRATQKEKIDKITIHRFPAVKLGGESFAFWRFKDKAVEFKPDIIIAHAYRHTHTTQALSIAKTMKIPVILVTHAPFGRSATRQPIAKLSVWLYDKIIAPRTLNKFSSIIAITRWEMPYLKKLGVSGKKINYIPNGIPPQFFRQKASKEEHKILFLGRLSPIKSLETVINTLPLIKDKEIIFEIVGPVEKSYTAYLKNIIYKKNMSSRVIFSNSITKIPEKIRKIDSAELFILPSITEGMPQSLIEALSRSKIVLASNNVGNSSLIKDNYNGFIFEVKNEKDCAEKIDYILGLGEKEKSRIKKQALSSAREFEWTRIISKIIRLYERKLI